MRYYEYLGKDLFRQYGIPVPLGTVLDSPGDNKVTQIELPAVLKVQVLAGKRGKGGGIKFADTREEAKEALQQLFSLRINNEAVAKVLAEEKIDIAKEYYLAITVEGSLQAPIILASASGGMDIEEVPPEEIYTRPIDVAVGIRSYVARDVAAFLKLPPEMLADFAKILTNLYKLFREKDAELVEINPLVITGDNKLIAADAKTVIDDDALFRQQELPVVEEKTAIEKEAGEHGLAYVELDGDIGVLANGAGITMATLDALQHFGGNASNFLDIGGGAGVEKVMKALDLILAAKPKALFINIFGGITRCDDVATALVEVNKRYSLPVPVVIRMVGTNQDEGLEILKENGMEAYTQMEEAAQKVVSLVK